MRGREIRQQAYGGENEKGRINRTRLREWKKSMRVEDGRNMLGRGRWKEDMARREENGCDRGTGKREFGTGRGGERGYGGER